MDRNNRSGLRAIFFDLDNTLISTRKADKLACNKISEILTKDYNISLENSNSACSLFLKKFRKCPQNPAMDLDKWRHLLWYEVLDDEQKQFSNDIYKKWLHYRYRYLAISKETQEMLMELKQYYYLALITNGPSESQWEKIYRLKIQQYFDVVLVSGDLSWEKPDPNIFHKSCDILQIKPHHCIMIGDKLETDIIGAIQANLGGTVWIPLEQIPRNTSNIMPDFTIKKITELLPILAENQFPLKQQSLKWSKIFQEKKHFFPEFSDASNSSDGS